MLSAAVAIRYHGRVPKSKIVPCLALVLVALAGSALAQGTPERRPKEKAGKATVVDGDTLRVGLAVVRLWGVDAPELYECQSATVPMKPFCGKLPAETSRMHLEAQASRGEVICREVTRDSFGQMVGECFVGKVNLGLEQIRAGHAVGWPSYLRQNATLSPPYAAAEAEARAARRGVWQ